MKKLKLLRRIAIATPAVLALSVLVAGSRVENTYALAGSAEQYHKLAVMRGVQQCYSSHAKSQIKLSDFTGWTSIFDGDINSDGEIIIPTKVGNTINDNDFSCQDVFAGYSGVGGSGSGFKNYATIPTTLANFGYVFSHNEGAADSRSGTPNADTDQVTLKFSDITDASGNDSRSIAVGGEIVINGEQKYHNGWVRKYYHWDITSVSGSLEAKYNGETLYTLQFSGSQYPFQAGTIKHSDGTLEPISTFPYDVDILWTQLYNGNTSDSRLTLADAVSNFTSDVEANVKKAANYVFVSPNVKANVTFTAPKGDDRNNANSVYKIITNGATASEVMLAATNAGEDLPHVDGSISGSSVGGTVKTRGFYWSDAYKYGLYYQYLRDIMSEYSGINIGACSSSKPDGAAYYFKGTKDNWCPINIPADSQGVLSKELAIVGSRDLEMGTFADILEWFKNEDSYKYLEEGDYANVDKKSDDDDDTGGGGGGSDPTGDTETTPEEACYRRAGSMGWIICPIIFGMRDVADGIYGAIEGFIKVDDSIVGQIGQGINSNNGSIYQAWNTFRGIANIVFVILFLVVIFSQLTGFGIDNYGIKKMLPKLIITAILINLSFIICAVAVDISNIVGRSIHDFFTGLNVTATIGGESVSSDLAVAAKQVTAYIVDIALVAGATVGLGALVVLNFWELIIPILLFLLTFVIAIIFAFIILGLRQAAVVVLIVIAPLALALYALPNTEKVFKKWVDAFKGVLVVYPIVGAVTGGGGFAGRVLIRADNGFLMTLTAGLLFVVPYFLIPSLMRRSLSAIGDIGNRFHNVGRNAGSRLSNGINNLDRVKNARADFSERNAQNRAERYFRSRRADRDAEAVKNGTATIRQSRRYRRNAGLANTQRQANIEARSAQSQYNRLQSETGYQAALSSANMSEADTAVKNFETMIAAGDYAFDYTDDKGLSHSTLNAQDNSAIAKALEHELTTSDGSDDSKARIRALSNALASKGKDGRQRMFNAVDSAQKNGASKDAIQTFSSNIQNNHAGTMKDKFRPLYEFTKKAQVDGSGNISDYKYSAVDKFSTGDMANMDVTHLQDFVNYDKKSNTYADGFNANFTSEADRATLTNLARQTLADEHLSQNLSGEQRSALEAIVKAGQANNPAPAPAGAAQEGQEFKIHNQDEVIRRVTAGELTPAQGDRWIEIMKNPTAAEREFINRTNQKIADKTYSQEKANELIKAMVDKSLRDNPNR